MAFHEVRLPARLAFGSTGGVERKTEITTLGSGFERRSTPWAEGRRRYLIGAGLRSLDDMAVLTAFMSISLTSAAAQAQAKGLPLIRDAEIEGLLRLYTRPIFKAAGINPKSVKVYIINDSRINAFVAGGQRIFVNTGLITQSKTPNEVIGVLAHETGHIAGGHLARMARGLVADREDVA